MTEKYAPTTPALLRNPEMGVQVLAPGLQALIVLQWPVGTTMEATFIITKQIVLPTANMLATLMLIVRLGHG